MFLIAKQQRVFAFAARRCIHTGRRGSTFLYQKSMPRLPIPKLADSCKNYLDIASCIVDEAQFERTKAAVAAFASDDGDGARLHAKLVANDAAAKHTSYINDYWFKMYLASRDPIAIGSNPFLQLQDDVRPGMAVATRRAAALLHSSARFLVALREETLEPDIFHVGTTAREAWFKRAVTFVPRSLAYYVAYFANSYPLCMAQYPRLFGSTRIPGAENDTLHTNSQSKHIVVMRDGRFYALDLFDERGAVRSPAVLEHALQEIVKAVDEKQRQGSPPPPPLAALTGVERSRWAAARATVASSSSQNARSLQAIDDALFILNLDSEKYGRISATKSFEERSRVSDWCFRANLHGNGRNRWFDKSFSLIVSDDAVAAINFEHAWGDGVSVLRFANEIFEDAQPFESSPPPAATAAAARLSYELSFDLSQQSIDDANAAFISLRSEIDALQHRTVMLEGLGKNFFKRSGAPPDGTVQQAIQLAYRRVYGETVPTYESASTAGFKHGRTEAIRPATPASVAFARAALAPNVDDAERLRLLRVAAETHKKQSIACAMGKGFDRHLFALRQLALQEVAGDVARLPSLFTDPTYARMNYNILSTSTLVSPAIASGGFGPVVRDGFGVGYGTLDEAIGFEVTSFQSAAALDAFCDGLLVSLKQIESLILNDTSSKA